MYIWRIKQSTNSGVTSNSSEISRLIVTSSKSAEDALYRLEQNVNTEGEVLEQMDFLGYIPGIAESGRSAKIRVYYALIVYSQPKDPGASNQLRRVVSDFYNQIDSSLAKALGVEEQVGPIPTGPSDAIDAAKMGVLVAVPDGSPDTVKNVIQSHIFQGAVQESNIHVINIRRVKADIA